MPAALNPSGKTITQAIGLSWILGSFRQLSPQGSLGYPLQRLGKPTAAENIP
jgi:hypothetical protein